MTSSKFKIRRNISSAKRNESSIFNEHSTSGSQRQKINIVEEWIAKSIHRIQSATQGQDHVHDRKNLYAQARAASEAGSSAFSPRTAAAAKRASLAAEAASLRKQQTLQEEELLLKHQGLKYQQQQEEAKLRLEQRKQQLQLETEIAKTEAEEEVYALAELGEQYVQLPSYARTRTRDFATSPLPGQPRLPVLVKRETDLSLPTPGILDPPSKGLQASYSLPNESQKKQDQVRIDNQLQKTLILVANSKPFHLKRLPGHPQTFQSLSSAIAAQILTKSSESEVHPRVIQQSEKNSYKI